MTPVTPVYRELVVLSTRAPGGDRFVFVYPAGRAGELAAVRAVWRQARDPGCPLTPADARLLTRLILRGPAEGGGPCP